MSERWRPYLLPGMLGLALFALFAGAGYLTKSTGDERASDAAALTPNGARGTIQSVSGNTLTILNEGGPRQFTLTDDVTVEALKPTTASTISVGEWLNAGTIPHTQTLFVIVGLNLIPPGLVQDQ